MWVWRGRGGAGHESPVSLYLYKVDINDSRTRANTDHEPEVTIGDLLFLSEKDHPQITSCISYSLFMFSSKMPFEFV